MTQKVKPSADVIFVGMNPSAKPPRKGSTRNRLHDWATELGVDYDFMNVINKSGPVNKSMVDHNTLTFSVNGYRRVIALGNFVSDALKKSGIEHFKLPHPSPRNRMLNDHEKISHILKECAKYLA